MALMIDTGHDGWTPAEEIAERLRPLLPDVTIYCGSDGTTRPDVRMLAVSSLRPGVVETLPNLAVVQKLGAGVETIVRAPDLPDEIRVARLRATAASREITEYALAYVLREQRNMAAHEAAAAEGRWSPIAPRSAPETTVAVLGLGHIGGAIARAFKALEFRALGWSRSPKAIDGVDARHGADALASVLAEADYVIAILPSTPETRDLFDAERLGQMKPGSMLINVGRGDLIETDALLAALEAGRPGAAVLDVTRPEPLPEDHPFWRHPKITITPHVSGWRVDDALPDVAENYKRLIAGDPLLHEVDRKAGY